MTAPVYPPELVDVVTGLRAVVNRGSLLAGAAVERLAEHYGTTNLTTILYDRGHHHVAAVEGWARALVVETYPVLDEPRRPSDLDAEILDLPIAAQAVADHFVADEIVRQHPEGSHRG